MVVYGYARLVGYDRDYRLVPDLLEDVAVEEGRIFTLRLRPGHRWVGRPSVHQRGLPLLLGGRRHPREARPVRPAPRLSRRGRAAALRGARRSHRALYVATAQSVLPAGVGRRAARAAVRPRALPQGVPRPLRGRGRPRSAGAGGGASWLGRGPREPLPAPTRTRTRTSPASSPGSTPRRPPRSATCSSATRTSTGWTRTAGSFPTSTGWS